MQIEVYRQTKPPLQRRPIVVSSLLFVLACALAARMSISREANPLGRTLRLIDLDYSIRAPRGFNPQAALVSTEWRVQPFEATAAPWGYARFAVWYSSIEHTLAGPERVAHSILEQIRAGAVSPDYLSDLVRNDGVLIGTAAAYEIQDAGAGLVVRVRELPGRGYLAVTVWAEAPMDQWIDRFDASCRSVQVAR